MKALSVKQPWANMIASAEKTIETRTWMTSFRGPILIISSKQPRIEPAGCVVAVATLTDCRPMTRRDERAACSMIYPNAKAWVLEEIRGVEPVPMRGALGLFDCQLEIGDLRWLEEGAQQGDAPDGASPSRYAAVLLEHEVRGL